VLDKYRPETTGIPISSNKKARINHQINEFQVELSHCFDKINALSPRRLAKHIKSDYKNG